MNVGRDNIQEHERKLNTILSGKLENMDRVSIVGPGDVSQRGGITSFTLDDWDTTEIAMHLDENYNVAVRSGMHCVHSWFNSRGIDGTARASIYFYNNEDDVRKFTDAIEDMLSG